MPKLKKINLLQEIIIVDKNEFTKALDSNERFAISLNGEIHYQAFNPKEIFIYQGQILPQDKEKSKEDILGTHYSVEEKENRVFITVAKAWEDILAINLKSCDYADILGQGVTEFNDKTIEDMSWMIIDFDVTYKEMIEFLEKNTNISLLYIDNKEPSKASFMACFDDLDLTHKIFFEFCQNIIKDKLANDPDYTYDYLDEDQIEAVHYFKVV